MTRSQQNDLLIIANHIYEDISYKEQGTFHKLVKNEFVFDSKEAERVKKSLIRLANSLIIK